MNRTGTFSIVCAGLLGFAFLLPGSAAAAWPGGSLTNVPLCTAGGNQSDAVSVSDGQGGAIVAWSDRRSSNAVIYAQRISDVGAVLWAVDGVALCAAGVGQAYPTIVADGTGGAIVTWEDHRSGNYDIYAQRISATGTAQWLADGVAVCTDASDQYNFVSTSDDAGGLIVAWWDSRSGTGDVYAQRISAAGTVQWAVGGLVLAAAANSQVTPAIAPDGAGGAIVAWQDWRSDNFPNVYVQRVSAGGTARWAANGVAICAVAGGQELPVLVADGAGGAIITWADYRSVIDIYAQKVSSSGARLWNFDGVPLSTATGEISRRAIASDGAGGAIVTWHENRNGLNAKVYAQRISTAGLVQWTAGGAALCTFAGDQGTPTIASDGAGGAIAAWIDTRSGSSYDIYAQRISAAGALQWPVSGGAVCTAAGGKYGPSLVTNGAGNVVVTWIDRRNGYSNYDIYSQGIASDLFTSPNITSIRDIANDQGGKVRVAWNRSAHDAAPALEISVYGIWRQASAAAAQAALAGGAPLLTESKQSLLPRPGVFRATTEGDKTLYWEGVGTVAARGEPIYTFVAPTLQDSSSTGDAWTVFMVDAHRAFQPGFFDSAPVSGYSVDNLAPASPTPFTGTYFGTATALHWGRTFAYDLAGYQLYRGDAANFVPGPATFVVAKPDTGYVDHVVGTHHYKLYAVDIHGNLSACAALSPQQTSPVPGALPATLRLHANFPNPFNPQTTIRFDLPATGSVRLVIYDVAGRLVRTLVDGELASGSHESIWDGRDASGRGLGSGSYLAKLSFGGSVETIRMGLIK